MSEVKKIVTQVAVVARADGHPVLDCIHVGIDDEAGGTFLTLTGHDEMNDSACLKLDWEEWDAIVEVVSEYRGVWETKEHPYP